MQDLTDKIRTWAIYRGLDIADPNKQILKIGEEFGEVCAAKAKGRQDELEVEIGDVFVTLTILALQEGTSIERCAELALNKIKDRSGKMVNGVFVKEDDL
jgi:NTP pyrophosphatase (non-canonical NTP hydrolase)